MAYDKLAERFERVCSELGFKIMEEDKMAKFIDAEKIEWRITFDKNGRKVRYAYKNDILKGTPEADVQPVVHGMWIREESPYNDITYRCSSCSRDWWADNWAQWNYCPNCGARMDGES